MPLEPWMGQIGLAAASVALMLVIGRAFVAYISNQLTEARKAHERELERLTTLWEARIADAVKRGDSWETAANRWQEVALEGTRQVEKLTETNGLSISLLNAIREEQLRR